MKIMLATHHFHPCIGGIESYVEDECKYLKKLGIECEVVTLKKCVESEDELAAEDNLKGIKIHRIGSVKIGPIFFAPKILKNARRPDIDAIHCHAMGFFLDFLILTKPIHRKPVFFTTQGGIFHTKKLNILKKIYFNLWERMILRGVDLTIAASENDMETFSKITNKIALIEDAFDSERVNSLGKRKTKNTFLFVGRLFRNKRCDDLLKTFSIVIKRKPDFKLYVVGSDWGERNSLEKITAELGLEKNVIFTGPVNRDELNEYYDNAEFFVSASEYEGFGISVIEAMAARCIPIINSIPTFRKFTQHGKAGFITNYSNHKEAAETILNAMELSSKEKSDLAEKAHNAIQKYSWETAAGKLAEIFYSR